jgi:hypothetical protein
MRRDAAPTVSMSESIEWHFGLGSHGLVGTFSIKSGRGSYSLGYGLITPLACTEHLAACPEQHLLALKLTQPGTRRVVKSAPGKLA